MSEDDILWAESFYAELEKNTGKPRPSDYLDRAKNVLYGKRKPVKNQYEGQKKVRNEN